MLENSILKIQWTCLLSKEKKKISYFSIGIYSLLIAIFLVIVRYLSPIDWSTASRTNPYNPYRDPLGYAVIGFVISIFYFYKYFKTPKTIRQSLQNENIYSIDLKNDFFIYTENLINKKIFYKDIKNISLYENKSISVRYFTAPSVNFTTGSLNGSGFEDFFHIPFLALEANKLSVDGFLKIFQENIRKFNSTAILIN